jgi:hypothetical protein
MVLQLALTIIQLQAALEKTRDEADSIKEGNVQVQRVL